MDQSGMENMVDTDIVEEVISSSNPEEETYLTPDNVNSTNQDMNHQFLNVQEAIFNPDTGTLQPITSVTTTTTTAAPIQPVATPSKPVVRKIAKVSTPQQQVSDIVPCDSGNSNHDSFL